MIVHRTLGYGLQFFLKLLFRLPAIAVTFCRGSGVRRSVRLFITVSQKPLDEFFSNLVGLFLGWISPDHFLGFLIKSFWAKLWPIIAQNWPFCLLRDNFLKIYAMNFFLFAPKEPPSWPLPTVQTPFWLNHFKWVKMAQLWPKMANLANFV